MAMDPKDYNTDSIMSAIAAENWDLAEEFARIGVPVNDSSKENSPLRLAVEAMRMSAIEAFIQAGADVAKSDRHGVSTLHLAALSGNAKLFKLLLEACVDAQWLASSIDELAYYALEKDSASCLRLALDAGANPKALSGQAVATVLGVDKKLDRDPLICKAAKIGGPRCMKMLIDEGADVEAKEESSGWSALMRASESGRAASARLLLPPERGTTWSAAKAKPR